MKKFMLLPLMLLMVILSACGGKKDASEGQATGETKSKPKTFIMASSNFNGDFYRGWTNTSYDDEVRELIWGYGLLALNPMGEIVDSPLIESKEVDGKTWSFTLKDGLEFSNGNPLTVNDVKFTYDFYINGDAMRETGGTYDYSQYIDKVEIDEATRTVDFFLKETLFTIDYTVFESIFILDSKTIEEGAAKDKVTPQQYVKANISTPVGYGAYKLEEYVESQYVKLVINDKYVGNVNGNQPSIDTLIIQNVPEETLVTQLMSGEIDAANAVGQEDKIEAFLGDSGLKTNNYFRHGGGQITFHTDFGPVQLPEVRKAFAYEFDREKFRGLFLGKYGVSSNAPYSRNMWMMYDGDEKIGTESEYERSLTNYDILTTDGKWDEEKNIAEARMYLDQAAEKTDGEYARLTKSGDTYLWDGEPIVLNLAITSFWSDAINLTLTKEIQERVGIYINVESIDWSIMATHLYGNVPVSERKYHMFTGGTGYNIKSNPHSQWSAKYIAPFGGGVSSNSARYAVNEDLLNDIRFSNPATKEGVANYKTKWRNWLEVVNYDLPLLPLYSNNYYDAYTNRLENFETNALWTWTYAIVDADLK